MLGSKYKIKTKYKRQVKIFFFTLCLLSIIFASLIYYVNSLKRKNSVTSELVTTNSSSREAFAKPISILNDKELRDFTFGNKMFNTNWVTAPASVTSLDGLGPVFNRVSCSACHFKDGRGRPPIDKNDNAKSMLIRLSIIDENGNVVNHPAYGDQLNDNAIHNVPKEGSFYITYEEIKGKYKDGSEYSLMKPIYHFTDLAFGDFDDKTLFSPRVASQVVGLGFLEAVSEEEILKFADPDDKDGDGISGRANYILSKEYGVKKLGRFGWKANVVSLKEQNAGAALGDIGITTSLLPDQNCTNKQTACNNAITGGNPEMSDMQLEKLTFYTSTIAVPKRRNMDDKMVMKGEKIFDKIGCASCHRPSMVMTEHKIEELNNQIIYPYTDMLLHDMGKDLADNRPDGLASGKEWRTPPLWGIGLIHVVNKHSFFLHDGRARNLEEAILWHGGEAKIAKDKFIELDKKDREALIKFLESL